ncbi:hypothetical protein BKA70DRAFT_1258952 [Coprinopsis sp. MPI-PUGE-AT-0042]|nr:hypothetical protein BKA70DRAFT_1258952 [Coprinopsis sp. MPI-PUGE-AT-0042]
MARRLFFLAALTPIVLAYSNTAPLLAWSSTRSSAVDNLPKYADQASVILDSVLSDNSLCTFDAVIFVQHPGLHASDLRTISPKSEIAAALKESPSARSYPYVITDDTQLHNLPALAPGVAQECHSRLLQYAPGDSGVQLDNSAKHAIILNMPALTDSKDRASSMQEQAASLSDELNLLSTSFPNHLVIYAGQPLNTHFARADIGSAFRPSHNTTLPEGGILKKYQLLTPGLITVLLIVLFVFIPVLWVGINALSNIQNPIKMDIPKGFNSQEKKNQ